MSIWPRMTIQVEPQIVVKMMKGRDDACEIAVLRRLAHRAAIAEHGSRSTRFGLLVPAGDQPDFAGPQS